MYQQEMHFKALLLCGSTYNWGFRIQGMEFARRWKTAEAGVLEGRVLQGAGL